MEILQAKKADLLCSLHVPGDPLILTNVWDAATARVVAAAPGVKAIATASHSISDVHGVPDGGGLSLEAALVAAKTVIDAVELPVTVDFERGYATDASGVETNVTRLLEVGAHGLNIEDSTGNPDSPLFAVGHQAERIAAVRAAAERRGIPLVINARVDAVVRSPRDGSEISPAVWDDTIERANAYLEAGADVAFILGIGTEDEVRRALTEIDGLVSVLATPASAPLSVLAELGVCRISFGPGPLRLALAHLKRAATVLTALGDYPGDLGFTG